MLWRESLSLRVIFDLGRDLLLFVATQLTVWCRGIKRTAKDFAIHFTISKEEWTEQAKSFSEDCWHLSWIPGTMGTSTAARDHLWLKTLYLPQEQTTFVNLCRDTGRGCRSSRTQVHRFHCNCVCAHSMVYCSVIIDSVESYIQQLTCGNFWSQRFKIQPPIEIVTPLQSNSDQKVLIYNKNSAMGTKI